MSELPEAQVIPDFTPKDERYAGAFYGLPLQATLNMLDAYQPVGSTDGERAVRKAMEGVRSALLVSGQANGGRAVDLSSVSDDALRKASEYVWTQVKPEIAARYRHIGAEVIPITGRQTA